MGGWGGYRLVSSVRSAGSSPVLTAIDPWIALDGRLNAPGGTPQFPTILNTYHPAGPADGRYRWPSLAAFKASTGNFQQAQWEVAGVDYAVGIDRNLFPTNASLSDPAPGGVIAAGLAGSANTFDGINININDNNFTVQGYDFSLHSGVSLNIAGDNCIVKNCNFEIGSNNKSNASCVFAVANPPSPPPETSVTILNCELNGHGDTVTGQAVGFGLIELNAVGTVTIKYNLLQKAWNEHFVYGQNFGTNPVANITIANNVMKNCGYGFPAAHGDFIQITSGTTPAPVLTSFHWDWNLVIQDVAPGGGGTQGVSVQDGNLITTMTVSNNTFIALGSNTVNQFVSVDITGNDGGITGTCTVNSNFLDSTGILGADWQIASNGTAGGTFIGTGNAHMTDGTTSVFP